MSAQIKYVESIVITIYIPIIGKEVITWIIEVKKLLIDVLVKFIILFVEVSIIDITWFGTCILSKFISLIYFWIWLYIFSMYTFKPCKRLEDSVIRITAPKAIKVINMVKIHIITITALTFLVNFVFLFTNFIRGSINSDIIKPIRKGI